MGASKSKVFREIVPKRVLLLGLDGSGKTINTIGYNVETIKCGKYELNIFDVGGKKHIRSLWNCYYDNNQAIIFVIDSSEPTRLREARRELRKLLSDERLSHLPFLIMINKVDCCKAMSHTSSHSPQHIPLEDFEDFLIRGVESDALQQLRLEALTAMDEHHDETDESLLSEHNSESSGGAFLQQQQQREMPAVIENRHLSRVRFAMDYPSTSTQPTTSFDNTNSTTASFRFANSPTSEKILLKTLRERKGLLQSSPTTNVNNNTSVISNSPPLQQQVSSPSPPSIFPNTLQIGDNSPCYSDNYLYSNNSQQGGGTCSTSDLDSSFQCLHHYEEEEDDYAELNFPLGKKQYHLQPCCALDGGGIMQGFAWMCSYFDSLEEEQRYSSASGENKTIQLR
ncbi:ARF/SAR family small GTPase [Naegleria gruberi]|uniref:ARF/SAR family small GTPase n=1 Tax=Naegleria gruberi TaxID=5762 RepID=D2VUE0_NAEGR|nr:ARF/SAR family small GTPase [Naegleria gruberi]EFC39608.1 ARF/SAR family small GTPase [Naegleria gruberi]|eukprot:XP_002672352.1 ARF/SAR family small GTPase [Naegleria gruberi strain NEG-M]